MDTRTDPEVFDAINLLVHRLNLGPVALAAETTAQRGLITEAIACIQAAPRGRQLLASAVILYAVKQLNLHSHARLTACKEQLRAIENAGGEGGDDLPSINHGPH